MTTLENWSVFGHRRNSGKVIEHFGWAKLKGRSFDNMHVLETSIVPKDTDAEEVWPDAAANWYAHRLCRVLTPYIACG